MTGGLCKCCGGETAGMTSMLCEACDADGVRCECGVQLVCGCDRVMRPQEHMVAPVIPISRGVRAGLVVASLLALLIG